MGLRRPAATGLDQRCDRRRYAPRRVVAIALTWSGISDLWRFMHSVAALSVRSYGPKASTHAHDHVQIVLPLAGGMAMEVGGRGGEVDARHGAFIAPGTAHTQAAKQHNRLLILDCGPEDLGDAGCERLAAQPYLAISAAMRQLLDYIELRRVGDAPAACPGAPLPAYAAATAGARRAGSRAFAPTAAADRGRARRGMAGGAHGRRTPSEPQPPARAVQARARYQPAGLADRNCGCAK